MSKIKLFFEFTLLVLEDTGLYKINNYTGGLMRFGKNTKCRFFVQDCNELLKPEEMKPNQTTTNKPTFLNEFCSGKSKTTCSSGRLSRGICYDHGSLEILISNDYQRNWNDYGNKYVEYCPISLNEIDVIILVEYFIL